MHITIPVIVVAGPMRACHRNQIPNVVVGWRIHQDRPFRVPIRIDDVELEQDLARLSTLAHAQRMAFGANLIYLKSATRVCEKALW